MMRLIDADELMEHTKYYVFAGGRSSCRGFGFVPAYYIETAQTIVIPDEAIVIPVEVVRCRDCKYFSPAYECCDGSWCKPSCELYEGSKHPYDDFFCSAGKKKEQV